MTTVFFSRLQWNNSLFLPSHPLEVAPLHPARGSGECCKQCKHEISFKIWHMVVTMIFLRTNWPNFMHARTYLPWLFPDFSSFPWLFPDHSLNSLTFPRFPGEWPPWQTDRETDGRTGKTCNVSYQETTQQNDTTASAHTHYWDDSDTGKLIQYATTTNVKFCCSRLYACLSVC